MQLYSSQCGGSFNTKSVVTTVLWGWYDGPLWGRKHWVSVQVPGWLTCSRQRCWDSQPTLPLKLSQPCHTAPEWLSHGSSHRIIHAALTRLPEQSAWWPKAHFPPWMSGSGSPSFSHCLWQPTSLDGCRPLERELQAPVQKGLGNFRCVFVKTKMLIFGRILRAQLCGGDS